MKKTVSILLIAIMILSCFSVVGYAAEGNMDYSATIGASYLMDIDGSVGKKYYEFSDGRNTNIETINDEDFVVIENPYESNSKGTAKNNSTLSLKVDAANLTFKTRNSNYVGAGIPGAINVNDDLTKVYIGFRIKIEDESAAFSDATSTMRISLESQIEKRTPLTTSYSHGFYWLDLNDGSMTYGHMQSGYMPANKNRNPNGRTSGIEFTGDMDGYLLIPIKYADSTLITKSKFLSDFKSIVFEFRTGDTDIDSNPAKKSSWKDKTVFLGDGFLVHGIDDFSKAMSSKRGAEGKMYSPLVYDTAYYAMRVAGYRSFDQVRVGDAFGKMPLDPNGNIPDIQSSRQFVHITTLPNGDRARELILNSKNNSSVVDANGKPYTSGEAMLSMYDNYDMSKVDSSGSVSKHGVRTKGVPSEIDLSSVKYLAFRVATRDGSKKNEKVEFSIRLAPSESPAEVSTEFRTIPYYLTEGDVTYLDTQTLKSMTISVSGGNRDKLITVSGNLDGYLIIPIDRFNTKSDGSGKALDEEVIRGCWGSYFNYGNQGIYYCLESGFENGKAFYAGDIFFVSNKEDFIEVRTTDCRVVGHKPVTVPEVKATCTDDGVSSGEKCSICDEELRGFEIIPSLSHDYKFIEWVAPSASSKAYNLYECQLCKKTMKKAADKAPDDSDSADLDDDDSDKQEGEDSLNQSQNDNQENGDQQNDNQEQNNNVIVIVIVVGLALLIALSVVLVIIFTKKKKATKQAELKDNE